ncbi:MAG: preprotein translocase subunit YajC [Deltaproteobacteria bacterium]|nr:preprotein translocase subunit YajC [Deltaproteobacteria bacterium]
MPFIILIFVFYFLLIRPQQKRAKEHAVMLQKLQKGDNVLTSGGIFGRITNVKDDVITVEIADNVRVKVRKSSVQSRKVDGDGNDTKAIKEKNDK